MHEHTQLPAEAAGSESLPPSVPDTHGLFAIACIFAAAGGYLDAYSYLAHSHVFANAQTGNVVFFGVYASDGNWTQAVRYLPPIAAFALGVGAAKLLGVRPQKESFRATLLCQAFELAILTFIAALGNSLANAWIVPMISFVAAMQNTSLDKIGPWSFNSAMTTGNLREATVAVVQWVSGDKAKENRAKAIALGSICCFFLLGALFGGFYTRLDRRHALAPCIAMVSIGFFLTFSKRRQHIRSSLGSSSK